MQLNKSDREAFIAAVMDDVPQVDYDTPAKKLAEEYLESQLPKEVRGLYKKYPRLFDTNYFNIPGCLNNFYYPDIDGNSRDCEKLKDLPGLWEKLEELAVLKEKQSDQYYDLKNKVTSVINSCRTLKQAKERLPEFEKYLPFDRDGTATSGVPMITNLVADLVKAGWPKTQGV